MKKFLTMVVALILLLSMSGCSSILKRKEAEYKAKVKQELDSIPLEETGYKLVEVSGGDPETFPLYNYSVNINEHSYHFNYSHSENSCVFTIRVDEQPWEERKVSANLLEYNNIFKEYRDFEGCVYFDNQIFLIIKKAFLRGFFTQYSDYLPPVLFLYNYEESTIKYCGYFEEWFNYSPSRGDSRDFKIIKL